MDNRYENPTIAMIYRTWRNRQNMVRAEGKLVLQIKAICRGFADGEIKEANKLFTALKKERVHLNSWLQQNHCLMLENLC